MAIRTAIVLVFAPILLMSCATARPCKEADVGDLRITHLSGGEAPLVTTLILGADPILSIEELPLRTSCRRVPREKIATIIALLVQHRPSLEQATRESKIYFDWEEVLIAFNEEEFRIVLERCPLELQPLLAHIDELFRERFRSRYRLRLGGRSPIAIDVNDRARLRP